MRKSIVLLLVLTLILSLMAGCSGGNNANEPGPQQTDNQSLEPSQSDEPSQSVEPSAATDEVDAYGPKAVEPATGEQSTGEVISADICRAEGYDVLYGMYDFETYTQLPLSDGGDTLTYWLMIQPFMATYSVEMEEVTFFTEMEKRTGVHVDVDGVSVFVASERFSLIVASGDMTDIMDSVNESYPGGTMKAIEDELFYDFNDFMEECMPNYTAWLDTFPEMRASITNLDGTIGSAGVIDGGLPANVGPQIREDWLVALNLDKPVTYDEYHDVLTAFKTEYGGGLWLDVRGATRNHSMSAGFDVSHDGNYAQLTVIEDKVNYSPYTENYRDYLSLLNTWWEDGLIYSDFITQADRSTPEDSLVSSGQVGLWVSDADTMLTYERLGEGIDVGAITQPRKTEDQQLHLYTTLEAMANGLAISTNCKDVELAAKWLDYSYTYDGMILNCYGIEGEGLMFNADGTPGYTDLVLNNPDMMMIACVVMYSRFGGSGVMSEVRLMSGYNDEQKDAVSIWTTGIDSAYAYPAGIKMSTETNERYSQLLVDIETYVEQSTLSFITGSKSTQTDWDAYLTVLESLGVEELVQICQSAYDNYVQLMQ